MSGGREHRKDGGGHETESGHDDAGTQVDPRVRILQQRIRAATKYNQEHPDQVEDFNRMTGGVASKGIRAIMAWQREHGLDADGKIGPDALNAAASAEQPQADETKQDGAGEGAASGDGQQSKGQPAAGATKANAAGKKDHTAKPKVEKVTFSEEEAGTVDPKAPAGESATASDAAEIIGEGDTSHNRKGDQKAEIEGKDVNEIAEFVTSTLDSMGVPYIGKAAMTTKLVQCKSVHELYEILKGEVTPEAIAEIVEKVAKKFALHKLEELAETAVPFLGGVSAGLKYASLSMEYIIGRANEEGRRGAQLQRYAAAWAFRFFDDGYSPQMLAPLDEQMELMNTCSRLGVEDAIKTLEQLGGQAQRTRQAAIKHYGGLGTARENLALELLKQAGVK